MKEDIEIIKCADEYVCELKPKNKREYIQLFHAYTAGVDEMRKRCYNRISELTEQLDAAHVFCEGVKEHFIKKACKWLENEYFNGKLREIDGSWFVFKSDFEEAMKKE